MTKRRNQPGSTAAAAVVVPTFLLPLLLFFAIIIGNNLNFGVGVVQAQQQPPMMALPGFPDECIATLEDLIPCFSDNVACAACVPLEGENAGLLEFLEFFAPPPSLLLEEEEEDGINCTTVEAPICPISTCCQPCKDVIDELYRCRLLVEWNTTSTMGDDIDDVAADLAVECPLDCEGYGIGNDDSGGFFDIP